MSRRAKAPPGCYWRGDVLWARVSVAGREYRWSLRTGNAAVAARRREAGREKLIAEAHYSESRQSYEAAFLAWSDWLTGQVAPSTATRYAVSLGRMESHLRGRGVDQIDKAAIGAIVAERRAAGVTNATIRRDLTALSSLLDFSEGEGWRDGNPALDASRKLRERRDPIVLPEEDSIAQVRALLPGLFLALCDAARHTGCRQEELVLALRSRLDHKRRQLTVVGKGNKLRVIDLGDAAFAVLAAIPVSMRCKYLFWHGDGEPYRNVASRFSDYVKRAQKAAQRAGREFRPFRFHDLRHLFAVEYLKTGGSIYDLQWHLGHTSVKTTEMYLRFLTADEIGSAKRGSAQTAAQQQRFGTASIAEN